MESARPEPVEGRAVAADATTTLTPTDQVAGHPERSDAEGGAKSRDAASAAERSRETTSTEFFTPGSWDDLALDRDAADESTGVYQRTELPELAHDLQSATELALLATDDPGLSLEELALMPPADPGGPFPAAADSTEPDPSAPAAPRADSPEAGDAPPLHGDDPAPTIAPGDYDPRAAASACVERALATDVPADRAAALLAAAGLLARAGAPADEVRPLLDVACEADPDSAEVFRARARVEAAVGDVMAAARALLSASIRAEGDEAGAAALQAASLFEEVGAPVEAARAYRAALHAQPGSPAARLALAETALASGDAAAATEHLGAIDASAVTGGERTELARRLARAFERAGHAAEAERVWRTVLDADPGDTEAFDRAEALAVETAVAGGGSTATPLVVRQAHHERSMESARPEPVEGRAVAAAATPPPTESIEAVHPERMAAEGGAESRDAWLEIARCDPADAEALRAVASLAAAAAQGGPAADRARLAELARLAASLAAFAAPGEEVPHPAPARLIAISPTLRDRVAAPGATGPLARLLALLSPLLEPLFPASLARCGATPADRLAPPRAPTLRAALEDARAALRGRPFAAFVSATPGADIAIENTQPPSLVAAAGVEALAPGVLAFAATRAVDLLGHGWALTGKFAPRDVAILLELACRFAGGVPPSQGLPAERAGAFLAALEISVPPPVRAEARRLAREASEELAATDPRAFAAALRRTANRVALLRCGDPGAALDALVCGDRRLADTRPAPAQALALADLRDVALFALSDPFLELRVAALG
ncbi:MAG TPA: tetratricopeptide repeat protein [Anaeromyxobacter sp.]|nr:tetratricopeptide repeat protein [Anaeromyxobacter sp.]